MKNAGNDNIRIVTLLSDSITKSQINFDDIMFETDKSNYDIYKVYNLFDFYFSAQLNERFENTNVYSSVLTCSYLFLSYHFLLSHRPMGKVN